MKKILISEDGKVKRVRIECGVIEYLLIHSALVGLRKSKNCPDADKMVLGEMLGVKWEQEAECKVEENLE